MKRLSTFLMALMLTWIGASAQVNDGGTYMLQNVETGYFLGGGGQWGTQAVTLARPQQFTIAISNDGYTLHSYQGRAAGGYLTLNLYVDSESSDVDWIITEGTGDNIGTYTISCTSGYLSAAGAEAEDVAIVFSETEEYWRIISPDDIKEEMKTASVSNPVDVTGLIMNPTLNAKSNGVQNNGSGDLWGYWTVTGYNTEAVPSNFTFAQHDAETCARVVETWHSDDGFDIRQTITDLPAGLYKFSAQGFYRDDDNASDVKPVIYAEPTGGTTNEVTLKNITSNTSTPGSMSAAYSAFLSGYYPNEIEFTLSDDGDATIGFRSDLADQDNIWTIFGEINLTYYGVVEEVDEDCDYEIGDDIEWHNFSGTVASTNLFVNGGFNNGVEGWTAGNGYTDPLSESNVTITQSGGYNHGPYVTIAAEGASNEKTPTQAIEVTPGKCYLFVGYTSGTAPTSGNLRFSSLFAMSSATDEANRKEGETSYSDEIVTLEWGNGEEEYNGWTRTMAVFSVPAENEEYSFAHVGMRMNWSSGSYDGLQLYELDGKFTFPEDADYTLGEEVIIDGVAYTVVSDNLIENGSFNERTKGWTYGREHTEALNPYNVTYSTDGGYNDGPYITSKGGGSDANTTPSKKVDVKTGKTYLFVGYTKGTTPDGQNLGYNGLFPMTYDDEKESYTEGTIITQMNWGDGENWTKTEKVFTATTDYVGLRFAWCPGACLDGFQLYQIAEPEEIDWDMTEAEWGTLILPFAADVPEGLTLYAGDALTVSDSELTVGEAATTIAANVPYLVSGAEGTYSFTGAPTNDADAYTVGLLTGTLVNMTYDDFAADGTEYVLQNHTDDEEGLAFYPIIDGQSTGVTLEAYHCYLIPGITPNAVKLPGMATAIEAVESDVIANDAIYDLSGRRLAKAVKGVYIQNGKKVLVK